MKVVVLILSILCIVVLSITFLISPYRGELEIMGLIEKNPGGILVGFTFSLSSFFMSAFNLVAFKKVKSMKWLFYLNIILVVISIIRIIYWAKFLEG